MTSVCKTTYSQNWDARIHSFIDHGVSRFAIQKTPHDSDNGKLYVISSDYSEKLTLGVKSSVNDSKIVHVIPSNDGELPQGNSLEI